jgi:hypothetical protein
LQALPETEVNKLHVAIFIEEDVFWLEISPDHSHLMELLDSEHYLSHVELRVLFAHENLVLYYLHKLSTREEIKDHIKVVFILKRLVYAAAEVL